MVTPGLLAAGGFAGDGMNAGHTPGPWRVSGATLDGFAPVMASDGAVVCLVSQLGSNLVADMRLIAAAPELLGALQAALHELIAFERCMVGDNSAVVAVITQAQAALAKATGQ